MRDDKKLVTGDAPQEYDSRKLADILNRVEVFCNTIMAPGPVRLSAIDVTGIATAATGLRDNSVYSKNGVLLVAPAATIDADTLDGHDSSYFATSAGSFSGSYNDLTDKPTPTDILNEIKTVDGAGSGLDADLLDGQHGAYYADIPSRLGYTPVQQGTGTSQMANIVKIGWSSTGKIRVEIDTTDFGSTWPIDINGNATTATNSTNLNGQPSSYYLNAANLTGTLSDSRLSSNVPLENANNTFTGTNSFYGAFGVGRAPSAVGGMYFNRNPDNPFVLFSYGDPAVATTDIGQLRASGANKTISVTDATGGYGILVVHTDTKLAEVALDPTGPRGIASKQYVDTAVAAIPVPNYGAGMAAIAWNGVGSSVFVTVAGTDNPGATRAGSALHAAGVGNPSGTGMTISTYSSTLPGTWVCLGYTQSGANVAVYKRIS